MVMNQVKYDHLEKLEMLVALEVYERIWRSDELNAARNDKNNNIIHRIENFKNEAAWGFEPTTFEPHENVTGEIQINKKLMYATDHERFRTLYE